MTSNDDRPPLVDALTSAGFAAWYRARQFAENIHNGTPYFNGASPVPDPERHSPSNLLQCHRKIVYRQENAPAETPAPEGLFWMGQRFEEDVIVPYLQDAVGDDETYVRNSMWINDTVTSDGTTVRFKGATDPVVVDEESVPLVVTEVKTKKSLEHVSEPNAHHRAQVHAYMHGLTQKYDRIVDDAVIIYGDRTTFDIEVFYEPFDHAFWQRILSWATDHTASRTEGALPADDPEYGWECEFCSYKHRCGNGEVPIKDAGPDGLLARFTDYPRAQLVEYLDAHEAAKLTPALASLYPDLATAHGVHDWRCPCCETAYDWGTFDWDGRSSEPPLCPTCGNHGIHTELHGDTLLNPP